jgi:carboxyl-terminal processing protease
MPLRNLLIIVIAAIISVACYSVSTRNRYANIFAEALNVVEHRALQSMSREDLFDSAMDGLVSRLDRHSRYLHDEDLDDFQTSIDQQFGGIGVFVGRDGSPEQLFVRAAFPGSPADRAGLQPGDIIQAIDGVALKGLKPGDAVKRMKGSVGQSVKVTVSRDGKPLDVDLVREVIDVPSVRGDRWLPDGSWSFTVEDDRKIGYLRVVSFGKETTGEFREALLQLDGQIDGLIIDLRANSGGLLDCAIDLCDMLLPAELDIVSIKTRRREIKQKTYSSINTPILSSRIPLVVLIDRYSASASEIMAGCLQDHNRAILIGEQTWGKGTVQDVLPIERGESALKLTTSSYWRPSGKNIDRDFAKADGETFWGVQPDEGYEVVLEEMDVQRNEYYRSEYELRALTGGMKFPEVFSQRESDDSSDTENVSDEDHADRANAKDERPELVDEVPSLKPFDPESYRDESFERALDYLRSTRKKEQPVAA